MGAAPNPEDFGLFLAREVRMIQPKMERNSHWPEVEVFQVQHHLCLLEEGKCTLCHLDRKLRLCVLEKYPTRLISAHLHLCNRTYYSFSGLGFFYLLAICLVTFLNSVDDAAISYTTLILKNLKTLRSLYQFNLMYSP